MNLFLQLFLQGVLLYDTLAWQVRMPKEIRGLRGSCLVIPCSFYYTSYPPTDPNRVVWYQWVSRGYPLVYDPWYPNDVIDKFRGKTSLYRYPSGWRCSLVITDLDMSHHGEKLYTWIDPENVGKGTFEFYDVTSTIYVDYSPKQPTISIYGGEKTGDGITVACYTYHTCPYSKPTIAIYGIEGSDNIYDEDINDGLWKITRTRKGVVKAEQSHVQCTVTHYGGITATASLSKSSACVQYNITIEPKRADVIEGVAKNFVCTVFHSCQKDLPTISWNYKNMEVSTGTKKSTGLYSAAFSNITFLGAKEDHGKQLTCTAKFSGNTMTSSLELHVQQYVVKILNPVVKKTKDSPRAKTDVSSKITTAPPDLLVQTHLYKADVVPKIFALPRSCVVIPCSFEMEEEHVMRLRLLWVTQKGYMFHTGQSNILENFRGRTRLLGNPDEQNCTVEIDDVKTHDNGPFCFQAEKDDKKYTFNNSCVFVLMRAHPEKPVMSSLPDNIEPGTRVTVTCSINHTCPSHPPSITWNVPIGQEKVSHRSVGRGIWETVFMGIFIPTGYEEEDEIVCRTKFWGDKTPEITISNKLNVTRIRVEKSRWESLWPYATAPALLILLVCAGVIIYMRRRRSRTSGGRAVTETRFNNRFL